VSFENRSTYRHRTYAYGYKDSDFYDQWYLQGRNLLGNRLDTYFSGRVDKDLDGMGSSGGASGAAGNRPGLETEIYQLYGDFHDVEDRIGLRIGRQYVEEAEGLPLDGGVLRFRLAGTWDARLLLGKVVQYDDWFEEERAFGLSLSGSLWQGNQNRLTAVYFDRESESLMRYRLDVWQRISESRIHVGGSYIDRDFENAVFDFSYFPLNGKFDASLNLSYWGAGLSKSPAYYPFYSFYGPIEPYTYGTAQVTWRVFPWLSLSPYAAARVSSGNGDAKTSSDYRRYGLTLTYSPDNIWSLSLAGDYWTKSDGERFFGVTGEVEYRPSRDFWFSLGTGYLTYRYFINEGINYASLPGDVFVSEEGTATRVTPDVYTLYGRLQYKFNDHLSIRLLGEIERDRLESDYGYGLTATLVIRF
jgi:hypothetical protein